MTKLLTIFFLISFSCIALSQDDSTYIVCEAQTATWIADADTTSPKFSDLALSSDENFSFSLEGDTIGSFNGAYCRTLTPDNLSSVSISFSCTSLNPDFVDIETTYNINRVSGEFDFSRKYNWTSSITFVEVEGSCRVQQGRLF